MIYHVNCTDYKTELIQFRKGFGVGLYTGGTYIRGGRGAYDRNIIFTSRRAYKQRGL
jgi:hypothetical protein